MPGKTRDEKENNLPVHTSDNLSSSFNRVFDLSNNRFEVRHIVRDPKNLTLHPRLTHEETRIFKHDADLIIRSVICSNLEIDITFASDEQNKQH